VGLCHTGYADVLLILAPELVGKGLKDVIIMLSGIECQVMGLRENFDGKSSPGPALPQSKMAEELLSRYTSLANADSNEQAIRHRRDIHPCRGGLQLIKGDDTGHIDRCLKKDLTLGELDRLGRGGTRGTFLFWKCDSCEFRLKYFVSKSRTATLLTNDDHLTFKDSKVRCSRALLAMSHLQQREVKRVSSSYGPPRYTCIICALHRPAARNGRNHTFSNRDEYVRHVEDSHIASNPPPAFVLQKLCIENGERLPDGRRPELWTA
jgi:hypothetical protein